MLWTSGKYDKGKWKWYRNPSLNSAISTLSFYTWASPEPKYNIALAITVNAAKMLMHGREESTVLDFVCEKGTCLSSASCQILLENVNSILSISPNSMTQRILNLKAKKSNAKREKS